LYALIDRVCIAVQIAFCKLMVQMHSPHQNHCHGLYHCNIYAYYHCHFHWCLIGVIIIIIIIIITTIIAYTVLL
jgi:hypothetical protein